MDRIYWFVGLTLFNLSATNALAQQPAGGKADITEISVQHTPCFGFCPVYKLILRRDNTATLVGVKYTDRVGTYKASTFGFDRLAQAIQRAGFFSLNDHYTRAVSDQPTTITTVLQGRRRKSVSDYGGSGPQRLWELEVLIDGMVAQAHWVKVSDSKSHPAAR